MLLKYWGILFLKKSCLKADYLLSNQQIVVFVAHINCDVQHSIDAYPHTNHY